MDQATIHTEFPELLRELSAFTDRAVARNGGSTAAIPPAHRIRFHWPPHPVSYSFHVLPSDWTGKSSLEANGEQFVVEVARTPNGFFGRCPELWHESRGETLEDLIQALKREAEPLFQRQNAISRTLEREGRFTGHIRDLSLLDLLKLFYCEDRDVANEARLEIEVHASAQTFLPALLAVLRDERHPNRRSAQWCVLDLFEDLPSFAPTPSEEAEAVDAMKQLLLVAEDDYARTIYKAGVVLGGHVPNRLGEPALMECLEADSRIGRRSAIHGLFHVVEWNPESEARVVEALMRTSRTDPDPVIRQYAGSMAVDIQNGEMDHTPDPMFPDEP